jgi:predicted Ser/Thr protein kinase
LLVELIHTDLEQCLKAGESARVEDFQIRFPELTESQLLLGDLIVTEYALRLQLDSQLDVAEYSERFPQWDDRLINRLRDAVKGAKRVRFLQATHAETIIQSGDATHSQEVQRTTSQHFDGSEQTQTPQNYDRYVVKELLGAGAFGQVFLARDPKTERDVALKVPRRRLPPGSEEEERFLREARAVATLQHQNICPLFDLLETDSCIVLVMPYIDGRSLAEEIRLRPPSLDESVRLMRTLATAMSYAHDSGVVHRDLKPANILVAREQSTPFITDFGLATRCRSDDAQLTQEGHARLYVSRAGDR